jgi:hypothetical protein
MLEALLSLYKGVGAARVLDIFEHDFTSLEGAVAEAEFKELKDPDLELVLIIPSDMVLARHTSLSKSNSGFSNLSPKMF